MRRPAFALMLALAGPVAVALPAAADDFTEALDAAREAYEAGDVGAATEELDYATSLLGSMKAEALAKFLPPPPAGWTRDPSGGEEDQGAAAAMAMFGGGTTAMATYRKDGADLTITLVADSPMVTGLGAMLGGLANVGGGGKPIRIQRTQFAVNGEELQGVVDEKVMVSVGGSASIEDKTAFLEAMDLRALGDF